MEKSGWSNEETISFLEYYQGEPCIWNPKDKNHKDKKKVADAWTHLSELTQKPVKELKSKKEILMTSFRKHLKKKQESFRSGAGAGDIYEPVWFAYQTMETFLLPVYTCNDGINTETQSQANAEPEETEEAANDSSQTHHNTFHTSTLPSTSTPRSRSRTRPSPKVPEQQMAAAFVQLTNALGQRQSESKRVQEDDDCDLYSKLLATKLRELPNDERKMLMYQINGLFIERINQRSFTRYTPYPQYYSTPLSVASAFTSNRSSCTKTSCYQPIPIIASEDPQAPSTKPSHPIIVSDEIIQPASLSKRNIINAAFLKTCDNVDS